MPKRRSPGERPTAGADQNQTRPRDLVAFAFILCATLVAYLPALEGGLLWDDPNFVTRPQLRSLHGLWRIWTDLGLSATGQYYPLVHSAFWFEHVLWGDAVVGYHLTNVVLHSVAALFVILIVRRLKLPGAWLAGLIFALHPVCVESVAWITEQKNTLSGVFYLASALTYLHFDQTRHKSKYFLALGLFALALASKTSTVPLPAVLLVLLWWLHGRLEWRRDVLPILPWFGLAVSSGLLTRYVDKVYIGAQGAAFALSLTQRILLAGRTPWFYASKLLWPVNLTFYYPRWKIDAGEWWQYLFPAGLAAVAVALGWMARRNRGPLAGFLIFVGTLFPVLGLLSFFYFRYSYIADHFQYLASLGIIVPVAAALAAAAQRWKLEKPWRVGLSAVLLACLAGLTWRQSMMYTDVQTLYRETLARNPDAWLAHDNLGNILFHVPGQRAEAIAHFRAAIRANPDYWEAHLSMGNALLEIPGRLDGAIAEYQTAVGLAPESVRSHTNLGNALLLAGRTEEAVAQYETALRIQPDSAAAHNDLANALTRIPGGLPDAIAQYQAAIGANPDFAEAHNNLGEILTQMPGRMPEAVAQFEAAIQVRPDYWEAHNNLGTALLRMMGRLPDAVAEYETALRIRPESAMAHNNLGIALSRMPDRLPDAVAEYRRALQLDPNYAEAHYNLAAALVRTPGGQAEALAECEAALRLRPSPQLQLIVERMRASRR
ncbi:MAG: tetratricopeptide repeat protein [Bryobacteraceae bacterium]